MADPLISVVMPAWNRAALVGAAIASIGAADGIEVIVIDDGSTDGTAAAARAALAASGLPGRVVTQANAGPGAARNHGARLATGRWLAFLDSDDLWLPWTARRLTAVVAGLDAPALVFVQGRDFADPAALRTEADAEPVVEHHPGFLPAVAASVAAGRTLRFASSHLIPRAAFAALGGYTTAVRCSEDTDLFLRARGPCVLVLAPVLFGYRTASGNNLSGNGPAVCAGYAHLRAQQAAGAYPADDAGLRPWFLAGSALYAARVALATGHPGLAYRLMVREGAAIARHRGWTALAKAALTPLLAVLRPGRFAFRWRPEARP